MKIALLFGVLACLIIITAACGSSNSNNVNPSASPSPTAAASPTPSAAPSPAASTGAPKSFLLVNSTGGEINALYISPSDTKEWGNDILGQATLPDGERTEVTFERSEKAPKWDLRIETETGDSIVWEDLSLLELKRVTLLYKNNQPTAETE